MSTCSREGAARVRQLFAHDAAAAHHREGLRDAGGVDEGERAPDGCRVLVAVDEHAAPVGRIRPPATSEASTAPVRSRRRRCPVVRGRPRPTRSAVRRRVRRRCRRGRVRACSCGGLLGGGVRGGGFGEQGRAPVDAGHAERREERPSVDRPRRSCRTGSPRPGPRCRRPRRGVRGSPRRRRRACCRRRSRARRRHGPGRAAVRRPAATASMNGPRTANARHRADVRDLAPERHGDRRDPGGRREVGEVRGGRHGRGDPGCPGGDDLAHEVIAGREVSVHRTAGESGGRRDRLETGVRVALEFGLRRLDQCGPVLGGVRGGACARAGRRCSRRHRNNLHTYVQVVPTHPPNGCRPPKWGLGGLRGTA